MRYRLLGRTGLSVSVLSFGASSLGGVFHDIDEQQGVQAVHKAIELGINFIDVSPYYGLTKAETVLGRALAGIPRNQYFLATKCGRYGPNMRDFDFSATRVSRSVDESLARLGVEYLDLIQIHDIEFGNIKQIAEETLPALAAIRDSGKARFVGITGLTLRVFTELLQSVAPGTVDTILSYCHFALNDASLLSIVPKMQEWEVGVINASPLGMGLLSMRGPPAWHPAPDEVKRCCQIAAEHCRLKGASLEKLAIQFAIREPRITTTLVGTADPKNIERNVAWSNEPIDDLLLAEVMNILEPVHNTTWVQGRIENN